MRETIERVEKTSAGGDGAAGEAGRGGVLPEWGVERVIGVVGRGPARVGAWLEGLAKGRIFPINIIVRVLSSVWMGILWLVLTAIYIAVGSGVASLRARLEITEAEFFNGWPMAVLMVLLVLTLAVVTVRRIPLTVYKLWVWVVHAGIITLVGGCFWYFSQKQEGRACLFLHQPVDVVFDTNERALYLRRMDGAGGSVGPTVMAALPGLPIYQEHLSAEAYSAAGGSDERARDNPVDIRLDRAVLRRQDARLGDLTVRVIGYYPYVDFSGPWMAGAEADGEGANPAVRVLLKVAGRGGSEGMAVVTADRWLLGKRAAERVVDGEDAPFGLEYSYRPTEQRVRDVTASFAGQMGMTVRVAKLGVERTYVVDAGKAVAVEGTPYTVTPGEVSALPMLSKGYEGGWSSAMMVEVVRKDGAGEFKFRRQALFRYPERSPDFVTVEGQMKRVLERVDNDIEIVFHDATRHQLWVIEDAAGKMTLAHRDRSGKCETMALTLGQSNAVKVGNITMGVELEERTGNAVATPRIVPAEARQSSMNAGEAISNSAVELEVSCGAWKRRQVYVPFVEFARWRSAAEGPAAVEVPGVGRVEMVLSTLRRELPTEVKLVDFQAVKAPGAVHTFSDFVSTVEMKNKRTGAVERRVISLNKPARDQGLTYFQAKWDGHETAAERQRFSVLGVGNRPGIGGMTAGSVLIIVGVLGAFYVKPVLLRMKKAELRAFAERSRAGGSAVR